MDDVLRQRVVRQRRAAGIPPDSTAPSNQDSQETPLDRFRQKIQEASANNIQRQQRIEETSRQKALRLWAEAGNEISTDKEGE